MKTSVNSRLNGTATVAFMLALMMMGSSTSTLVNGQAAGVTCPGALLQLLPCLPFLTKQAPSPSTQCCSNVKLLNDEANTAAIRQQLCKCFKPAIITYRVDPPVAKALPSLCGVNVPVPIDPNIDCNKDFNLGLKYG
ncbi:unnamed protein product [Linum tenue]|uniref:Non-specific lipid-transfer protein n=1 Tax=Linum tenue TaxID=586396 RepID=A0AAV0Q4W3_9ROSI|nr:unnamed protein product [Linum tenue]